MKKVRLIINAVVFCLLIVGFSVFHIVMPDNEKSVSERSHLLSFENVLHPQKGQNGKTPHSFEVFEEYMLDQFPLRDELRTFKALVYTDVFRKNDNNKIYVHNGSAVEIIDKLDEKQVSFALNVFEKVSEKYFGEDNKIYYSIIPDKHYYASIENGYPAMDYEKLFGMVKTGFDGAEYIDITSLLSLSDFYKTDSHWSQDKILDVAEKIALSMNSETKTDYKNGWNKSEPLSPFYGVYYGRSALSLAHESIVCLENEITDRMIVKVIKVAERITEQKTIEYSVGEVKEYPVYVREMFANDDPYDVFLAGPEELIVIENPMADNDKELVIFRDSFGSSISPLIACAYKRVVVVDLRYIVPDALESCADFSEDADVLFLYSTGMYNNGATIKPFIPSFKPQGTQQKPQETVTPETSEKDESSDEENNETEEITKDETSQKPEEEKAPDNETSQEDEKEQIIPEDKKEPAAEKKEIKTLDNGIMLYDGSAFEKNDYNKAQADYAVGVMNNVISRLLSGNNVYISIVPDKNYQALKATGGDTSGYTALVSNVTGGVSSAKYIDIMNMLSLGDYYKTDAHWKQESIVDVANKLVTTMNPGSSVSHLGSYAVKEVGGFSGTYLKSGKVDLPEETVKYLDGGVVSSMTANALNNAGKLAPLSIYSEARLVNTEEYDLFLGGAQTIVTIENPNASNDKELVVFRDSFGSSIAPLLAQGYRKTTFVDLRYVVPDVLPMYVNFENSDVLFLYSANILNNGRILKNFMK